jgi:hypothetical protein
MIRRDADIQLQGRNSQSRKLANHTYLIRDGEQIHVRLHSTNVITFNPDDSITLNSGGWHTATTKDRINQYIPAGYRITQAGGVWFLTHTTNAEHNPETKYKYEDGITITANGNVIGSGEHNPQADTTSVTSMNV